MADDVRNDQTRSISTTSNPQSTKRNKSKRQTKSRSVSSSPEKEESISARSKNRRKLKDDSQTFETKTNERTTSRGKRKTSESINLEDIPGPSGLNKHQKFKDTQESFNIDKKKSDSKTSLTLKSKSKRKTTKKKTSQKKSLRTVESDSNLPSSSSPTSSKKSPLKKSKSDSIVTATTSKSRQGLKRKARKQPVFSPKKLRSSTHAATTTAATSIATATLGSQGEQPSAKTGSRTSRIGNPPVVDQPTGGASSDKLGSCASRRRNRRTGSQQQTRAMESERNGNSSTQESTANEEGDETSAVLTGATASLSATSAASSSGNTDVDLAASLEEGDMTRLQALLEARGLPAHLFGSLGPRMHLLLHKTFNSGAGAKAQQLLTSMQSEDEGTQLQGVMEMCQLLVMGNEETLGGFPVKQVVPVLITLLKMEHNFDIMNHACRALTYLMEGLPRSSVVVIDAVPMLLEKLQTIQCMDVAEQSLTALEMLSKRHGKNILQAGGLGSSLLFLDFFSIVAQRSALATTANCCHSVTVEDFQYVRNSIEILSARLLNQDKKSLESVCVAFARLVDNVQKEQKLLEELCAHNLLANLKQLLIIAPPLINSGTFVMVIRMLAIMCGNCPSIAVQLLKLNITETLRYLLIGSNNVPTDQIVELIPRSPQELYELITLICELLPNLPSSGIFSIDAYLRKGSVQNSQSGTWQWKDDRDAWHTYIWVDNRIIEAAYQGGEDEISLSTLGRNYIIDFANMQQINEDTGTIRSIQRKSGGGSSTAQLTKSGEKVDDERSMIFEGEKGIGKEIVQLLIAVVFDVYYSSVGPYVKHKCLNSILKMLYHSPSDLLKDVLSKIPISSYIAGMLTSQDVKIVCSALQKADILMSKLSGTFHVYFRREGVMHRVQKLANGEASVTKGTPSSSPNKNGSPREEMKHSQAVGSSKHRSPSIEQNTKGFDDISSVQENNEQVSSTSSTSKLASLRNRKKGLKKLVRSKTSKSTDEQSSTSLRTKRSSHESMRPKSATFVSAGHSASTGNVASKTSFFSSFTPRWGRSQSFQNTSVSGSTEKKIKESLGKEQEHLREKIRTWIQITAQDFYTKYFTEEKGISHPALDLLHKLTTASEQLSLKGDTDRKALEAICEVLLTEDFQDGASPFEMVHSGMVTSLLRYLTSKAGKSTRTARIKRFLTIFLGLSNINNSTNSSQYNLSTKPTLVSLVQKLNLCINQLEQFPVKCQDIPGSGIAGGSRGSSALRFFNTHQIKCSLQRHPDCSSVKQWCGGAVKIDPLALVQAIERYLVVRGFGRIREDMDSELSEDEDHSEDEIEECWASQLQLSNNPKHILEFTMNGHVLPYNMTVYQAVRQYAKANHDDDSELDDDSGPFGRASIWSGTHTIYFRPISQSTDTIPQSGASSKRSKSDAQQSSSSIKSAIHKSTTSTDISKQTDSSTILTNVLPGQFASSDPSVEVICLLRVLYYLNSNWRKYFDLQASQPVVPLLEFVNTKLTAKATRQLQDPLVIMTGNLPSWLAELAKACPFIFPFECRQLLFYTTTFDRDRAVMKLQETVPDLASTESSDRVAPRLDKKKRTVSRGELFKQADIILNEFTNSRALLEIQYEGEVGTGLGPTLEFYSLVSKEFQRAELEMWRGECVDVVDGKGDSKKSQKYSYARDGLFPAIVHKNTKASHINKLKSKFRYLGKFMAKACMDSRMIDINFSETFYKWLVTCDRNFDICDMQYVDKTLYKSLSQLYDVVLQKKRIESDTSHTKDSLDLALSVLTLDGVPIEDLGLDFVLPGTNYELKKNGKDIPVAIDNLEEYLQLVVRYTLLDGVSTQLQAFKEGFEQFFQLTSLQMFYPHEIDLLLCGSKSDKWNAKDLMDCCRADHGYTIDSRALKFLFEILSKYNSEEQRLFLQFITGSPKLPVGGFKSLNPPLTIVRKTVDNMSNPDLYLPSVMTCVNYLKLPDYSSVDIMSEKLRTAYLEGKNAFHLS